MKSCGIMHSSLQPKEPLLQRCRQPAIAVSQPLTKNQTADGSHTGRRTMNWVTHIITEVSCFETFIMMHDKYERRNYVKTNDLKLFG